MTISNFNRSIILSLLIHALLFILIPGFGWRTDPPAWIEVSVVAYPEAVAKTPHWQSGRKIIPEPSNAMPEISKVLKPVPVEESEIGIALPEEKPTVDKPDDYEDISPLASFEKVMPGIDKKLGRLEYEGDEDVSDITGPVTRRKLIRKITPKYPEWAQKQGVEGEVKLKCWVTSEGIVNSVELLQTSGYPDFDSRAIEALKKYLFSPLDVSEYNKEEQWGTITIKYTLKKH